MPSEHRASRTLPFGFHLLLAGQSVSLMGTQVSTLALPLTAIAASGANAFTTGMLLACARLPYLLVGLFAGLLVDRISHRRLLMAANVMMALVFITIPLVALSSGHIRVEQLYAVALLTGTALVVADITFLSWVPALVQPSLRTAAQNRIELAQSVAVVMGLPMAGWLIGALTAPIAILTDALSLLIMTALLLFVPTRATSTLALSTPTEGPPPHWRTEALEGARFVMHTPLLRTATLATVTLVFFQSAYAAVFILHLSTRLHMNATEIGLVTSVAAIGSLCGAVLARPIAQRLGVGRTLALALTISAVGALLCPLFPNKAMVAISQCTLWLGMQVYNVHQVPIRSVLAPERLHGRVNASIRTLVWGLAPLGAVLGGISGNALGTSATLTIAACLMASASLWIIASPLWAVRTPYLLTLHSTQQ
ncbi:MFS transporter [Zymobacter sp. IVIA_5232.4 C2]|uniref:MFS transporter n=1 Tax=Zymobacter sp. IVIA_5232.4 C2 TaxID=3394855 RepID=UPI0039C1E59B